MASQPDWRIPRRHRRVPTFGGGDSAGAPPTWQSTGGGNGNPPNVEHAVDIGKLKSNVGFLNWAVGIIFLSGLGLMGWMYVALSGQIDTSANRIGDKLDGMITQVSNLRVEITKAEDRVDQPKLDTVHGGQKK